MTTETLSAEDKEFLAKCEEEFKDRYTENDEGFMKVHNAEPSTPPIVETWWVSHNSGRNDRRFNRHSHPYDRPNRDRRSGYNNEYDDNRVNRNYNRSRY